MGTPLPPSSTPSALRIIVIGAIGISAGSLVYMQPTMPQSASIGVPSYQRFNTGSSALVRAS